MKPILIEKYAAAPPSVVFALASDFPNVAETVPAIERIEMLTDGPVGVGTRFRETRIMFKREATEEMEVVQFDPPNSYALACESCGCLYRSELRFTPKDSGTLITQTTEAKPLNLFAKIMGALMGPLMWKKMRDLMAQDIEQVAAAAEARARG